MKVLADKMPTFRKYNIYSILDAILYVVKTGCQWNMLPDCFPKWKTVYHHFRSLNEKGAFQPILAALIKRRRNSLGKESDPTIGIADSESVRSGLPQSVKGIDGHKRIKGIKRNIITDTCGYPLAVHISTANVHDSKAFQSLLHDLIVRFPSIRELKADKGYRSCDTFIREAGSTISLHCVKSNFGTKEFLPIDGRWVVERTFSWMTSYRRLCRNYEKTLQSATGIYLVAAIAFMLRFFR